MNRPIKITFILVQPEEVARTWTAPQIEKVLEEFLKIWAGTVEGEALDITIDRSEPAPSSAIKPA